VSDCSVTCAGAVASCGAKAGNIRFVENPQTGRGEAVPRHTEIANLLAKKICRNLSIPDPPG
jgi:hypothetical protein